MVLLLCSDGPVIHSLIHGMAAVCQLWGISHGLRPDSLKHFLSASSLPSNGFKMLDRFMLYARSRGGAKQLPLRCGGCTEARTAGSSTRGERAARAQRRRRRRWPRRGVRRPRKGCQTRGRRPGLSAPEAGWSRRSLGPGSSARLPLASTRGGAG